MSREHDTEEEDFRTQILPLSTIRKIMKQENEIKDNESKTVRIV